MNYVYIDVPEPFKSEVVNFRNNAINARDTVGEYPFDPHVTLKWGLETGNPETIAETVKGFIPIRVMFGATKMFMADEYREYDVLKVDVFGQSLNRLNKKLSQLKSLDIYQTYSPHMTLNYLKPRYAMEYIGNNPWIGKKFVVDKIKFQTETGQLYNIYCDGSWENA